MGTIQSTLTDFQFVSEGWTKNCNEERLLGVSMTGIMDCPLLNDNYHYDDKENISSLLQELRAYARTVNKEYAERLGIPASMAITCVKPSGTVSELVGSSSGIHPRHNEYYIRSIRQDNKDPVTQYLKDAGIRWEPAQGKENSTTVFYFPQRSPQNSVFRNNRGAIQQLEHWLLFQRHWCDHKPSVTIYVKEHEWLEVGAWVYKNFDEVSGVSFLPFFGGSYPQAPFQDCTKEEYERELETIPKHIDWDKLVEEVDSTTSSQELACVGGACTI